MPNTRKPAPKPLLDPHKSAPESLLDAAEASENAPPALNEDKPPALRRPAQRIRRQAVADRSASGSRPERAANRRNALAEETHEPAAPPHGVAMQPSDPKEKLSLSAQRLSGRLAALAETAKAYARSAQADNTQRAYAADWRHFASWLRRQGLPETPPDPEAVGLYLASQVERRGAELSVATLERRLSGIA
jgi:hypothetical protein